MSRKQFLLGALAALLLTLFALAALWSWLAFRPTGIGRIEVVAAANLEEQEAQPQPTNTIRALSTTLVTEEEQDPKLAEAFQIARRLGRALSYFSLSSGHKMTPPDRVEFAIPLLLEREFFPEFTPDSELLANAVDHVSGLPAGDFSKLTVTAIELSIYRELARGNEMDAAAASDALLAATLDDLQVPWSVLPYLHLLANAPTAPPAFFDAIEQQIRLRLLDPLPEPLRARLILASREESLQRFRRELDSTSRNNILAHMANGYFDKAIVAATAPLIEKEFDTLHTAWFERDAERAIASQAQLRRLADFSSLRISTVGAANMDEFRALLESERGNVEDVEMILFYLWGIRQLHSHGEWPRHADETELARLNLLEEDIRWEIHWIEECNTLYFDRFNRMEEPFQAFYSFREAQDRWPTSFDELAGHFPNSELDAADFAPYFRIAQARPAFIRHDDRDPGSFRILIPPLFSDDLKQVLSGNPAP